MAGQGPKLISDIFWLVGRNYLSDPVHIYTLASTCRRLWGLLEDEIYIADVLDIKSRGGDPAWNNRCEPLPYDDDDDDDDNDGNAEHATEGGKGTPWNEAQGAGADPNMLNSDHLHAAGPDGTRAAAAAPSTPSAGARKPPGRFPAESGRRWLEKLREDHPRGGLHALARAGPAAPARKLVAAAGRFWPGYVDLMDAHGDAPIHLAARHGRLEVARLLAEEGGCSVRAGCENACYAPRPLHEIVNYLTGLAPSHDRRHDDGSGKSSGGAALQEEEGARKRIYLNASSSGDYYGLPMGDEDDYVFAIDALGLAILGGHEEVAHLLLAQPCYDGELIRRSLGRSRARWLDDGHARLVSPLHLAALAGMPSVVGELIARGANPNVKERAFHDCSPLHMACTREGTRDVIESLLRHGAELYQLDDEARSVVQWAEAFGVEGLPEWLRLFGASELSI